jgi:four helix bundle protein
MSNRKTYDLEDRTAQFGESIIALRRLAKQDAITKPLISQLVRSGASVGANYMEANGASSRKDFANKIHICKKEAQETKHWLRMLARGSDTLHEDIRKVWKEAQELTLIFGKIAASARK